MYRPESWAAQLPSRKLARKFSNSCHRLQLAAPDLALQKKGLFGRPESDVGTVTGKLKSDNVCKALSIDASRIEMAAIQLLALVLF